MSTAYKIEPREGAVPFQEASIDIWNTKYRLTAKDGTPIDQTMDDTYKRVAVALADVEARGGARRMARALPVGAAQGSDPRGPHHLERRRPRPQARDLHDQLHGVGHDHRLDGRHPQQGPRGRPHAQGGLRHRLRVLDAAAARRVRLRRRRLHVRAAVVHGYLRQDVLHGVVGRRSPRRADGHLRHRPPGRDGVHPRQARERAAAAVQPVAARH